MLGAITESTLADVCSLVTDGTHDTPKRVASGYPLIKAKEITGGRIDFEACDQISEKDHLGVISRSKPEFGDTLFAHIGASLGEAAFVNTKREFSIKNVALFKPNPEVMDARYLYYLVVSPTFQSLAKRTKTGSAQPFLGLGQLRKHCIQYHLDMAAQQRIAGILSAYDDLIENSQRRIQVLEKMARNLYREWFVHFKFPGHEKTKIIGGVPEGWGDVSLFDLAVVKYGKGLPKKKLVENGAHPVYGAAKIIGQYTEYTREHRTIICGCRGSVGEMQITQSQCFVTNNSFTFDPSYQDDFFWLYHALMERGLRDVIGGAAQPQITLDGISSVELFTPPRELRTAFQKNVVAMFEQAWVLQSKVQNLRRTRDLLLPRLLTGQINLGEVEE